MLERPGKQSNILKESRLVNISTQAPDNVRALGWAVLAVAMFSMAAVLAKVAVNDYHVLQILFFRQIVVFLSCLPSIAKSFPASLKTHYPLLHAARLLGAFIALSFGLWAVAVLPLTTAVTLSFAQAFFIALLAMVFLDETLGRHRLSAIVIGFFGVVLVMQPGVPGVDTLINPYMLVPVFGAMGAAVAVISVRKLSQTESTQTLLVYQAVFVGVLAAVPLLWFWKTPDMSGLLLLLAMGVVATVGQWVGVKALRLGEATLIGTVKYTELVFAAIFGLLLFQEIPDAMTMLGAALIVASALYMMKRESQAGKT